MKNKYVSTNLKTNPKEFSVLSVFLMNSASGACRLGGGRCQVTCRHPTPCLPPTSPSPNPAGGRTHCWGQGDGGDSQGAPILLKKTDLQSENSLHCVFLVPPLGSSDSKSIFISLMAIIPIIITHLSVCFHLYKTPVFPRRLGARRAGSVHSQLCSLIHDLCLVQCLALNGCSEIIVE